jgi:hypothetical protein
MLSAGWCVTHASTLCAVVCRHGRVLSRMCLAQSVAGMYVLLRRHLCRDLPNCMIQLYVSEDIAHNGCMYGSGVFVSGCITA